MDQELTDVGDRRAHARERCHRPDRRLFFIVKYLADYKDTEG